MKEPALETLGDRIRYGLENHPMGKKTQEWLRQRLGVSQGVISQWCSNMQKPKNLHAVAQELALNFDWLETGKGEPYSNQPNVHERIPNYKNLRDALIKAIFSGSNDEAEAHYAALLDIYIEDIRATSGNDPDSKQILGYLRRLRDDLPTPPKKGEK